MKEQLHEIHNAINNIFEYNIGSYKNYKILVEKALELIRMIPEDSNAMLKSWKTMAMDELQKELNGRLSDKFVLLSPDAQKTELKFSKMAASVVLMNIIMHL